MAAQNYASRFLEDSHRHYSVATHPETRSRLDLINQTALIEEPERELTFPKDEGTDPKFNDLITGRSAAPTRKPRSWKSGSSTLI